MDLRIAANREMLRIAVWREILAAITEEAPKGVASDIQNLKFYMVDPGSPPDVQKAGQTIKQPSAIPANHPAFYVAAQYAKANPGKFYIFSKLTPLLNKDNVHALLSELVYPSADVFGEENIRSLAEQKRQVLTPSDIRAATRAQKTGQTITYAPKNKPSKIIKPEKFGTIAQRAAFGRQGVGNVDINLLDQINPEVLIVTGILNEYTGNLNTALDGIRIGYAVKRGPPKEGSPTEESPGVDFGKRRPYTMMPWTGGTEELEQRGFDTQPRPLFASSEEDYVMKEAVRRILERYNVITAYLDSLG